MRKCDLCGEKKSAQFLDLGKQPMANKYPTKDQFDSEEFFPLKVYFCTACKNIQLDTLVSRNTMFEDYYYLSSVNETLVKHYENLAKVECTFADFVVDIGSNDGISLKPLKEMGVKCLGVEPSINVSKIANDAGYETMTAFFNAESAKEILDKHGKADVITGLSMFSHLQDQHQFIEDVKTLLTDDGRFIVEVEYNASILNSMSFERFYLDRIFYFSVTSFQRLFEMHDMYLSDVKTSDIHGGSLRVTAQKKGKGNQPSEIVALLIRAESEGLTLARARDFGKNAKKEVKSLKNVLEKCKRDRIKVAGYGAPARVATITNFGDIGNDLISFIVDDSPLKQNRYSPGKHISIVPNSHLEENRPDVLVMFAYDYFYDIKKKLTGSYQYLLPIPPSIMK